VVGVERGNKTVRKLPLHSVSLNTKGGLPHAKDFGVVVDRTWGEFNVPLAQRGSCSSGSGTFSLSSEQLLTFGI
jgi:hypothetical protein